MNSCSRILDFDAGHRVLGHQGKCKAAHGHRYRVEITCTGAIDSLGMVIDFGVVKQIVGEWIDEHWDHAFLVWERDEKLIESLRTVPDSKIAVVPFNPTAENMAEYLLRLAGNLLREWNIVVSHIRVYETPNCWADCYA